MEDNEAPAFVEALPADDTVSCEAVPDAAVLTATDNCDASVDVSFEQTITGQDDECPSEYTIVRTWTVADCAGNEISHTQTISVEDNEAPTFVETLPVDATVSCNAVPDAAILTATDNCDASVDVSFEQTITGQDDECPSEYTIVRTWTVADCAGNEISHTQTISVEDNEAPSFVETLPVDATVSCDAVPDAAILTATDNCDASVDVSFEQTITGQDDECPYEYTITRTWTVADCAGNETSHTQTITVEDNEAPAFVETLPTNISLTCNDAIPEATTLTAVDNCDPNVSVSFEEVSTNDANCIDGYTITRTWSTVDCSGNSNEHIQIITIPPTEPITASTYDDELTITCGEELPPIPELIFSGGCGDYNVVFTEETIFPDGTEDYMVERIWEVTDRCGNMAMFTQTIFVMQPMLKEVSIKICVEDEPIDLINYLPETFATNGSFVSETPGTYLNNTLFVPYGLKVGKYLVSYSAVDGPCKYYVDFVINVHSDCVPCSPDKFKISKTVTPNGDMINDYFTVIGNEYCEFVVKLKIFNRWGDMVYESNDYRNEWNGFAPSNAVGNSGVLPAGTYYYIIELEHPALIEADPINGFIYLNTER